MQGIGAHGPGRPSVTLVDQYGEPLATYETADGSQVLRVHDAALLDLLAETVLELRRIRLGLSLITDHDLSKEG